MRVVTDSTCTDYCLKGHPECPQRVSETIRLLQKQVEMDVDWAVPVAVGDKVLLRAHSPVLLDRLAASGKEADFDPDTPAYPEIEQHARRSVGAALACLDSALDGKAAFSLMRPPGHHATPRQAMGFCYYNQAAIAALEAKSRGVGPVAVFDFDVHHGNGTEEILLGCEGLYYFSVHEHPCYPGTGKRHRENCRNYPLRPYTSPAAYRDTLSEAWEDMMATKPALVILSAGFDAYRADPLAHQLLEERDFEWLGRLSATLPCPGFGILEGGYAAELPQLVLAFLAAWDASG